MGEPRRIEVMSNVGVNLEKNKNKTPPTHRLIVPLTQSTDDTYPEFSYAELCKKLEDKLQVIQLDPEDPFAAKDHAEHEKMLAIARDFESKYAPQPTKRKHVSIIEDFIDLGEGYEEDSFVDNSEAYDELVPSTMRTKYGGFYINTGELDFVSVEDASQDGQPLKKKMKKRRVIQSDDEDDNRSEERKKKVQKMKENGTEEPLKKKRKKLNVDDGKRRKGPPGRVLKGDKCRTVAEILNEVNQTSTPTAIKPPPDPPSQNLSPIRKTVNPSVDKSAVSSPTLVLNRSVSITAEPTIERDSNDESNDECVAPKNDVTAAKIESSIDAVILQSREGATSDDGKDVASEAPPQSLPDSLPVEVAKAFERITELASSGKLSSDESPSGLRFTPEVQQLLLEIHEPTQKMSPGIRSAIYSHLGNYFPCGKEALIKRIKKLDLTQHGDRLKQPIAKLKEAIQVVMPSLIEKHRVEVSAKEKLRLDQLQEQKEKKEPKDGATQSDSDEEDDNRDTAEKQRRIVAPRKKFEWNEEIRKHLCKVVDIKMEHYEMSKIRSQSPEEYLKSFLEAEIKSLWPSGWIQTRMLFKESRSSHIRWTSNVQKMKKSGLVTPKTSTPIVGTPTDANPDAGIGPQAGNVAPFATPVSIPLMKASIWPLLDEVASANFNKPLETHPASDTPGTGTTNGAIRPDSSGEVLFTSISAHPVNVSDKEAARSDRRDSTLESDVSCQRLRKMLLTPVLVQELDLSLSHSLLSKSSRADRSATVLDGDLSDVKVVSISSSTGSDTSLTKVESMLGTCSVVDLMATERPSSSCPPKGLLSPDTVPQGYLQEYIHFSSKNVNTDEGQEVEATSAVDLPERSLKLCDDSAPTPVRSSGTSFPRSSESSVQSASGKQPSEPPCLPITGPGRNSEVVFTEVRPLQRQSSHDATGQPNQTVAGSSSSTFRKVTPITLDTYTAMAPPNSHKAQELMALKNDANFTSSQHRDQYASSRTMPKARNQMQPQLMALPNQQKLTGSPTSNVAQRWPSKTPLTQAWLPPGSFDERLKSVMDLGTSVSSSRSSSSVVNPVSVHSSGMHNMQHMTKDSSSSRTSTAKIVSTADDRSMGRPAGARTGMQAEEATKGSPRLTGSRPTSKEETVFAGMMSGGNEMLNQVLSALFKQETASLMMSSPGSHQSTQGSKKTLSADVQTFPSTSASDSTKLGPDATRMFQTKSLVSSPSAQPLWRPTDQARNSSASSGVSAYGGSGYRGGLQHAPGGIGDGSVDYSQHQSTKTSSSSQQQSLEVLKHSVSHSGAPAAGQPQQLKVFYGSSAVQRNTSAASQGQNTSTNNMSFKTDSQSSQHHHQ